MGGAFGKILGSVDGLSWGIKWPPRVVSITTIDAVVIVVDNVNQAGIDLLAFT
jgi:hypothetical protein